MLVFSPVTMRESASPEVASCEAGEWMAGRVSPIMWNWESFQSLGGEVGGFCMPIFPLGMSKDMS